MTWPLLVYFVFVVFLVAAVLGVSYLLGQRHSEPATGEPYEGGIVSEGSARVRFSVRYYLIAMFFVVFDLEAVFLFAWAGSAREVGWSGYFGLLLFVGHHSILAWGSSGQAWESAKLSDEGVTIAGIDGGVLRGKGWEMMSDREKPFALDLRTGMLLPAHAG